MRLRPLQRAQRLAARRVGAADHPRGASQIRAPRLRAGRGAEHDERIFRPRNTPRIRCRQVVAPPALEALSGRGVAATTQRSRTWHAAAPSKHLAAATLKTSAKIAVATRRHGSSAAASEGRWTSTCAGRSRGTGGPLWRFSQRGRRPAPTYGRGFAGSDAQSPQRQA